MYALLENVEDVLFGERGISFTGKRSIDCSPGGEVISGMNLVQVCRWASSYPSYKCILDYGKSIPINV